jgi:hypothetical protein
MNIGLVELNAREHVRTTAFAMTRELAECGFEDLLMLCYAAYRPRPSVKGICRSLGTETLNCGDELIQTKVSVWTRGTVDLECHVNTL